MTTAPTAPGSDQGGSAVPAPPPGFTPRPGGPRRLPHRDRRAGQGRRSAALPRRRHRGPRRHGDVRQRLGAARRRPVRPGPAARRAVPDPGAHRRRPGGRAGRAGDARPVLGLPAAARHRRRGGPRPARPGVGDGAVLRGAVGARDRRARGAAVAHRPVLHDHRAVHDALARRAGPGARRGRRRLLGVGRRARHERLDLHRPGHRLHRRRRGGVAVRRDRRHVRPAARRRPGPGAADDRGGRAHRRPRRRWSRASSTARSG